MRVKQMSGDQLQLFFLTRCLYYQKLEYSNISGIRGDQLLESSTAIKWLIKDQFQLTILTKCPSYRELSYSKMYEDRLTPDTRLNKSFITVQ